MTLSVAPPPTITIAPSPVVPVGYVMHTSTIRCRHCGTATSRSNFMAMTMIRSRLGTGRAKHFTPCDQPLYNLPVERLFVGIFDVPFCGACPTISLSHLPPPPTRANLYDLPPEAKKGASASRGATPRTTTPKKATLGDLA